MLVTVQICPGKAEKNELRGEVILTWSGRDQ